MGARMNATRQEEARLRGMETADLALAAMGASLDPILLCRSGGASRLADLWWVVMSARQQVQLICASVHCINLNYFGNRTCDAI